MKRRMKSKFSSQNSPFQSVDNAIKLFLEGVNSNKLARFTATNFIYSPSGFHKMLHSSRFKPYPRRGERGVAISRNGTDMKNNNFRPYSHMGLCIVGTIP
jgi:hypothetical protein